MGVCGLSSTARLNESVPAMQIVATQQKRRGLVGIISIKLIMRNKSSNVIRGALPSGRMNVRPSLILRGLDPVSFDTRALIGLATYPDAEFGTNGR